MEDVGQKKNNYEISLSTKLRFVFVLELYGSEVGDLVFYVLRMLKKLPYCFVVGILYHMQLLLFTSALQYMM